MKHRQKQWRVRVLRKVEDWVELGADTPADAEQQAAALPGIINVFVGSTISADKPIGLTLNPSIEDDD